ncbi:uncharacterized protein LOC134696565 [Mytilus trossulus]|uniref:uncharacterized protein LOC134696565 n=1 Tax=Mytilus trossulus TaxID=6551 RepID=UPI003007056E
MEYLANFLNAVIVLPFTAGDASENQHVSTYLRPHDGSVSGIIILSSVLVIAFLAMFGIRLVDANVNKTKPYFTMHSYLYVTIILSIVVFIAHFIIHRVNRADRSRKADAIAKLKLGFLWIFTSGSILYAFVKIIRIPCKENIVNQYRSVGCIDKNSTYYNGYVEANISFHCTQILFYFLQSLFIHFFIRGCFKNSWIVYYSLVLIVLANISQWAHYFSGVYQDKGTRIYNLNCSISNYSIDSCYGETVLIKIEPYLTPVEMEYFLLSMIFIAELWPSNNSCTHEVNVLELDLANEYTPFKSSTNRLTRVCWSKSVRTTLCVICVVILFLPCYIFGYFASAESEQKNKTVNVRMKTADILYDMFLSLIKTTFVVISFYMISKSSYFRPLQRKEGFHFHHKMIIASFLGSIGYLSLIIFSSIHGEKANLLIAQKVLTIIELYFQLICILQLNNYKKYQRGVGEYIYLALSIFNLCDWIDDSFFGAVSVYDNEALQYVYDTATQRHITNFLFPFLIFFRFESFVFIYGTFRQTLSNGIFIESTEHLLFDEI